METIDISKRYDCNIISIVRTEAGYFKVKVSNYFDAKRISDSMVGVTCFDGLQMGWISESNGVYCINIF